MTVINDVKTTLAELKSAQSSFETFALGTEVNINPLLSVLKYAQKILFEFFHSVQLLLLSKHHDSIRLDFEIFM